MQQDDDSDADELAQESGESDDDNQQDSDDDDASEPSDDDASDNDNSNSIDNSNDASDSDNAETITSDDDSAASIPSNVNASDANPIGLCNTVIIEPTEAMEIQLQALAEKFKTTYAKEYRAVLNEAQAIAHNLESIRNNVDAMSTGAVHGVITEESIPLVACFDDMPFSFEEPQQEFGKIGIQLILDRSVSMGSTFYENGIEHRDNIVSRWQVACRTAMAFELAIEMINRQDDIVLDVWSYSGAPDMHKGRMLPVDTKPCRGRGNPETVYSAPTTGRDKDKLPLTGSRFGYVADVSRPSDAVVGKIRKRCTAVNPQDVDCKEWTCGSMRFVASPNEAEAAQDRNINSGLMILHHTVPGVLLNSADNWARRSVPASGYTPEQPAIRYAVDRFNRDARFIGCDHRFVIVVADGAPNDQYGCGDIEPHDAVSEIVGYARQHNVHVFGCGIANAYDHNTGNKLYGIARHHCVANGNASASIARTLADMAST